MRPIFKTEMFICLSRTSLAEKILFGTVTHHLEPEIREMYVNCKLGNENSIFHSGDNVNFNAS